MYSIPQNYLNLLTNILKDKILLDFSLNNVNNFIDLIENVSSNISKIIRETIKETFETIDQEFLMSKDRINSYYYKDKHPRTIITIFGEITYERYFYYSKNKSKSFFYIDEMFSLPKYDRFDPLIKALLMEEKASNSFQKAGNIISLRIKTISGIDIDISRQQVFSIFKKLDIELINPIKSENIIDEPNLYIMLDEKYVHLQNDINDEKTKNNVMVKHCVIYTKRIKSGKKRYKLINKQVFSSVDTTMNFVEKVQQYVDNNFKAKSIKNIILSGDGAGWIKSFYNDFSVIDYESKIFILDGFHTMQAITRMVVQEESREALRTAIINLDKDTFIKLCDGFKLIYPDRFEVIETNANYLINNWRYIKNQKHKLNIGCSMEGHISHNLAKFFTRDPKAYSYNNMNKHIILRDLFLNCRNIKNLVLNSYGYFKGVTNNFNNLFDYSKTNVPILKGKCTTLRNALNFYCH